MKKLIIFIILLFFINSEATEPATKFWFSVTEKKWDRDESVIINTCVEILNYQGTNETDIVRTTENTNNVLHQWNFGYTDGSDNVAVFGYTVEKCGGYSVTNEWAKLEAFCAKNKGYDCGWDMGLTEYMNLKGLTQMTNQWLILDIPLVDDGKKINDRESKFNEKKQSNLTRSKLIRE